MITEELPPFRNLLPPLGSVDSHLVVYPGFQVYALTLGCEPALVHITQPPPPTPLAVYPVEPSSPLDHFLIMISTDACDVMLGHVRENGHRAAVFAFRDNVAYMDQNV
jgi:hypothetical protein